MIPAAVVRTRRKIGPAERSRPPDAARPRPDRQPRRGICLVGPWRWHDLSIGGRALGVQIAIDDFGTGYSSLAYLERFPVTHIKIDRSFVTPLDDPQRGDGVVRAIVEIGRALSLTTVAEGIETPTELQRLRELGCGLGQGYLFSRPLERDAMADLVARKTGPVFAREVAMADRQGTVGTKGSSPARAESGAQPSGGPAESGGPSLRLAVSVPGPPASGTDGQYERAALRSTALASLEAHGAARGPSAVGIPLTRAA